MFRFLAFFWFSVSCCFCVFLGLFSGDLWFSLAIYIRFHHRLSSFVWVLAREPRTVASEPLLYEFTTLAQTFSYATDYSYVK